MVKKIAAINDLSGFGRSSLTTVISVISAMGIQCCPIPTAVLSSHMALKDFTFRDLTADLSGIIGQWHDLGLKFDAIYSGFLSSAEQIDSVLLASSRLMGDNSILLVDPVMGDNGKLYKSYTSSLCEKMAKLAWQADIITPNMTEAAILLGENLDNLPKTECEVSKWAARLSKNGPAQVVITGLDTKDGFVGVACCENGSTEFFYHEKIGAYFPGTGDLFATILLCSLLSGDSLKKGAKKASDFVWRCIDFTVKQGSEPLYGVQFEPFLCILR